MEVVTLLTGGGVKVYTKARTMGMFKVKYIERGGHAVSALIYAKTKRLARHKAEEMFEDIIRVKRVSFPWLRVSLIALAVVVAFLILR